MSTIARHRKQMNRPERKRTASPPEPTAATLGDAFDGSLGKIINRQFSQRIDALLAAADGRGFAIKGGASYANVVEWALSLGLERLEGLAGIKSPQSSNTYQQQMDIIRQGG